MKKTFGVFIICVIASLAAPSFADSIIDYSKNMKKLFDSNPVWVNRAIQITDVNTYGRCANVSMVAMAMEVRGERWDDKTAAIFAGLGETMRRVRLNFLSKGYSDSNLGSVLRSYSARPVDTPDMQFCIDHFIKITQ